MTKKTALWLALAVLGGCGLPPEPILIVDLETSDRKFEAPSRPTERPPATDVLKKDSLTITDVLMVADAMNPVLAAERKNIDLANAAIWEAKLYPNPSALLAVEDYKTKEGFGSSKRTAGLGIPVVLSGRIGSATSLAEKERELAAVNYVWRRREILTDVKRAFAGLLASRRNRDLTQETRDLAKAFNDVTSERFKAQAIPEMELLKAQVQLAKANSDLRLAEKDADVSLKALYAVMGNTDLLNANIVGTLHAKFTGPTLDELRNLALAQHPLLESARRAKEAAELNLALVKAERFSDLSFDVRGGVDGDRDGIVEAGLTVPLPLFNRNQAKITSAEIRIRQSEDRLLAIRNDLVLKLTEAHRNYSAGQDRVASYLDEILPRAQKASEQTNDGYRQGKYSYLDVLDSQRTLADAKIAYSAALADLNFAAIELEKLVGEKFVPVE